MEESPLVPDRNAPAAPTPLGTADGRMWSGEVGGQDPCPAPEPVPASRVISPRPTLRATHPPQPPGFCGSQTPQGDSEDGAPAGGRPAGRRPSSCSLGTVPQERKRVL